MYVKYLLNNLLQRKQDLTGFFQPVRSFNPNDLNF